MKLNIGDLVKPNNKMVNALERESGIILFMSNGFYCKVFWLCGRHEWMETKFLEVVCK